MIVKWPALVKPSTISTQYMIIEDFFPTMLDIAGVKNYKTAQAIDGKSFLPILKDADHVDNNRVLIWHYPHKWINEDGPGINYFSAIRKGEWKLVYSLRTGKKELYNLKEDISESNNLVVKYPEIVKQLADLLTLKLKAANAPMPTFNATGKPIPWPNES